MASASSGSGSIKRTWLLIGTICCILPVAAFVVGGLWWYRSPAMSRRIEALLSRKLHAKCLLTEWSIAPLRGCSFRDLFIERCLCDSLDLIVRARRVYIAYSPIRVLITLPAIVRSLSESSAQHGNQEKQAGAAAETMRSIWQSLDFFMRSPLGSTVKLIRGSGVTLEVFRGGTLLFSMSELQGQAALFSSQTAALHSEVGVESVFVHPAWRLERGAVIASVNGKIARLIRFSGTFCGGHITASGRFNLQQRRIDTLTIIARHIDAASLSKSAAAKSVALDGRIGGRLVFQPSLLRPDSLSAEGTVTIVDAKIHDHPLRQMLLTSLLLSSLKEIAFEKVTGRVFLTEGTIYTTNVRAQGNPLSLSATGSVSFGGHLDYTATGTLSRVYAQTLPAIVRESLVPASNGSFAFSFRIFGSADSPTVIVDREHTRRAMGNVLKSIQRELKRFFR